mmetsp:Transcript_87742/g.246545  ORF Transcript_87742/g.246545 Transcript_87742/m.246545 type:complete len:362 (+) Transcript_87742:178-1263(+)
MPATLGPSSATRSAGPLSMKVPAPAPPTVVSSMAPVLSKADAKSFMRSMSPVSLCTCKTFSPLAACCFKRSTVNSTISLRRDFTSLARSFLVFSKASTEATWPSGAIARMLLSSRCCAEVAPNSESTRPPATKCKRTWVLPRSRIRSVYKSFTWRRCAVFFTWVPQHKFVSMPSISSTRSGPTTPSGRPRHRISEASSESLDIHRGATTCSFAIASFTRFSSRDISSSFSSSVPRSSVVVVVGSVFKSHDKVSYPNISMATAVMRCCAECWCIKSWRRSQSTSTRTSTPSSSAASTKCTASPSILTTRKTLADPILPKSHGCPPPSGKSTVSSKTTSHTLPFSFFSLDGAQLTTRVSRLLA